MLSRAHTWDAVLPELGQYIPILGIYSAFGSKIADRGT